MRVLSIITEINMCVGCLSCCNPFVDLRQPAKFQILAISIRRLIVAGFKLPPRGWEKTDNMC